MNEQRVIIYISATKQTTTAKWHLEGMYPSDLWIAVLHDISDLKPFLGESKVRIRFRDITKEAVFYYGNGKLTQVDSGKLDYWVKKSEAESEEKSMLHNVTVKHEENKVLEWVWVMIAMRNSKLAEYNLKTGTTKDLGEESRFMDKKELSHAPTLDEIAQFLSDSKSRFRVGGAELQV